MAVNKVVYNAKVLLDLTSDTVTAATLSKGVTAHDKSGAVITGTMPIASEIMGDTGFLSLSYVDVTIGANTVSLGGDALVYLYSLVDGRLCAAALLNNPTTQNQLLLVPGAMKNPSFDTLNSSKAYHWMRFGYRYRTDGTYQPYMLNNDYAFVLKSGTRYRLWVADVKLSNLKPY